MPDDIKISALTNVNTLSDTAVFPMVQDLNGTDTTLKASMSQVAGKVAEGTTFVNLTTTAKDLVGAINEAASTGGSVDITTSITTPASVQTFNDGGDNIPLKSLVTEILPIQSGSGVPSPSNVRAISGHSSVNVVVTGKNILDVSIANRNYTSPYTFFRFGGTSADPVDGSLYLAKGTYTFSISTTAYVIRALDKDNQSIEFVNNDNKLTFTLTESQKCMITMAVSGNVQVSDFTYQLELNDEATTYEPYKGSNTTIPLGSTVYGGSLECVEGSGQITKAYVEFDGSSDEVWNQAANGAFYISAFTDTTWQTSKICNLYQYGGEVSSSADVTQDKTFYAQYSQSSPQYCRLWVKDTNYATVAAFTTFLASNTLQVVYGLKTPTSLSVTGANIPTLLGVNNIYTDCGDIQALEYFNENGNDIDSLVNLETRLSGRIRTKTYTGDGSVPLVVTFDEVPTMILNIFGNGQGSQVLAFPFIYGLTSFGGVYVTPNPWTPPTQAGGNHLLYKVAYSNGGKTMTVRASAGDAGAQFNQSGDTYTIYYLV